MLVERLCGIPSHFPAAADFISRIRVVTSLRRGRTCPKSEQLQKSIRTRYRPVVFGIGPPVVGNDWGPARPSWDLVIRVAAQAFVKITILPQFLAIPLSSQ